MIRKITNLSFPILVIGIESCQQWFFKFSLFLFFLIISVVCGLQFGQVLIDNLGLSIMPSEYSLICYIFKIMSSINQMTLNN